MLRLTKVGQMLAKGFRNRKRGDIVAIKDVLARVSALVEAIPEISEIDFNPVMVLPPGAGVRIVDARIRLGSPPDGR